MKHFTDEIFRSERTGDDAGLRSYAFGPFVLIPKRQTLLQGGEPVRIGGRALDILIALVERAGELVLKRELMARVWPDTVVDEGNLKVNITALRRALGDGGPDDVRYIATVSGRGYKLIVPVTSGAAPGVAPAPTVAPARRHNLPIGTTRVIGRADAIDAIRRDFDIARLVSIVGPGGIGKTTVAVAVAEQAIASFRDGVWLVDLSPTREPNQTAGAIAAALGVVGNAAGMLAMVCKSLRDREMLLVLDSCEHVIDEAAACAGQILASAAGVKILVTSREPLQINGERVRRLPGLGTPPSSNQLNAEDALMFPAVQLFVDRASDRLDSFKLSDADAPTVAQICQRLDGLALAIELAASRIDGFGVAGLLTQLDDRFRLLVGRSGPERHRTLTATLGWSYGLLSAREADLLCAVSVFAGVFDIDGASVVAGMAPAETADTLAQLAAKSLLMTDLDSDGFAYRLLETTNTYCREKLHAGGDEHGVRQRHAEHTYAILERAASEWAQRPAEEWGNTYGRVLGDLRAALTWTEQDARNGPLSIRLAVAGLLLWTHFSLTEEGHIHASHAVGQLDAAGLSGTAFEMKLKLWLGGSTMLTRQFRQQAMESMQRARAIAIEIGDSDYLLRCLMMIGIYQLFTGQHHAGMRTLENFEAVAAAEDPSVAPEGDVHMGVAELFLGRLHNSQRRLERLEQRDLRYFGSYAVRYLSDPIVLVRSVLVQVQWLTGAIDTAMHAAALTVDYARRTKHHLSLNNILSYACPIFYWSGNYDECARYVAMLEEHVTQHSLVARRPVATFYGAALAYARDGASSETVNALQRAIGDFREINHLARMPYYLSVLADALADSGRGDEAQATIRMALEMAHAQEERWCLPEVLRIEAAIALGLGKTDEAEGLLIRAMEIADETGGLSWRLRSAIDLARLWRVGAKRAEARAMLLSVLNKFSEGFATRDLVIAAELIDG